MQETKLFIITYFAALGGVLPPGLVNMTVAKTCVKYGKRSGLILSLGATLTVFFQAFAAIVMAKYVFNNPDVRYVLLWIALVVFVGLGIYFFRLAFKNTTHKEKNIQTNKYGAKRFLGGVLVALVNVFPIPYFVSISTLFNPADHADFSWWTIVLFSLAAAAGSFTSFYIYVISFLKIEKHTKKFSTYSNYFMAGLMTVLTGITVFRLFFME